MKSRLHVIDGQTSWREKDMGNWKQAKVLPSTVAKFPEPAHAEPALAEPAAAAQPQVRSARNLHAAPPSKGRLILLFTAFVCLVLYWQWTIKSQNHLTPEKGLGYALGVVGGLMMLLLIVYPIRKSSRSMRRMGSIKFWFQVHIIFGILGPALILLHTNFKVLESLNSTVAMACTILVAISGFVGRYLHTKVHYGLYCKRVTFESLHQQFNVNSSSSIFILKYSPQLQQRLIDFESRLLAPPQTVAESFLRLMGGGLKTRWTQAVSSLQILYTLRCVAKREKWPRRELKRQAITALRHIHARLATALQIAELSFYERLLALWRLFHMPLFILLVVAGLVHVLAVHMY